LKAVRQGRAAQRRLPHQSLLSAKTKANLDFLALFVKVLADHHAGTALSLEEEQEIYVQIENLYSVEPELRTLGVLANTLPKASRSGAALDRWRQFGFLFDNTEDT